MKKLLPLLFAVLVLCILCIAALPTILSTHYGKNTLLHLIQEEKKEIAITNLSLSWLGPQVIEGLEFKDPSHGLLLSIPKIILETEVWHLFFKKKNLKKVSVLEPLLQLTSNHVPTQSSETTPKKEFSKVALGSTSKTVLKTIKKKSPFAFKGCVKIEKGVIEIAHKDAEMIKFLDVEIRIDLPTYSIPKSLAFSCQTYQNNSYGKAELNATLRDDDHIEMHATAIQLPIAGIDNLLSLEFPDLKGILFQSVGATLDLKLDGLLSKESFLVSLSASSPNLLTELHTKKEGDSITFLSPGSLSLNLTPELLETIFKIAELPPLSFQSPTHLNLKIPNFKLPINKTGLDFTHASIEGSLSLSPSTFTIPVLDKTLKLTHFAATFSSNDLQELLTSKLDFTLSYLNKEASVALLTKLASFTKGEAKAQIHNFPTALLDKRHYFSLFLGNTLDLNISAQLGEELTTVQLDLKTPFLEIPQTEISITKQLTLDTPATLSYTPPSQLFDFFKLEKSVPLKSLKEAKLTIETFKIPDLSDWHSLQMKGEFIAQEIFLFPSLQSAGVFFPHLTCNFDLATLEKIHCEIESPTLQTEFFASINPTLTTLDFKKTTHLKYLITQDLFHSLIPHPFSAPRLERPALSDISIDPFTLPLSPLANKSLLLKGKGSIDTLSFKSPHHTTPSTLEEIVFKFLVDQKNNKLSFDVEEKAKIEGKSSGTIDLSLHITPLLPQTGPLKLTGKAHLKHLKTQVLESLLGLETPLLPILGPTLDVTLEATEKENSYRFLFDIQAEHLKGTTTFSRSPDGTLFSNGPTTLQWTVSPEGLSFIENLAQLETPPPLSLVKSVILNLNLTHFSLPHNFDLSSMKGEIQLDTLSLLAKETQDTLTLSGLKGTLEKKKEEPLSFSLQGKSSPSGEIDLEGTLNKLSDAQGNFTLNNVTTHLRGEIRQFPTPFIDLFSRALTRRDLHLTTLLGDKINANITAQIEKCCGTVHLTFLSDLAKASLDGTLTSGLLTLTAPFHAQFQMTTELSKLFLKKANPLKITSFTSNDPITLEISDKGFSLPLFPFNLSKVAIPSAHLELGKITCTNRGNLKSILNLLKKSDLSEDKTLEMWFTPINMHMHEGIFDIERTEILIASTFEVALWGSINFPKDYVDMVLGLTKPTLQEAFHIKHLPSDYVLHIPLTGPTKNVSFNKVKATTKIASLLAWQHTSKEKDKGSIWGGLLQSVGTLPDKDAKTPPQNAPLPWDKKPSTHKKSKKTAHKIKIPKQSETTDTPKNTNPLKELFKAVR